jgi:hypothetical protein
MDEMLFGKKGDLLPLWAWTLEGLDYVVDSARKRLRAARPLLAARGALTSYPFRSPPREKAISYQ